MGEATCCEKLLPNKQVAQISKLSDTYKQERFLALSMIVWSPNSARHWVYLPGLSQSVPSGGYN